MTTELAPRKVKACSPCCNATGSYWCPVQLFVILMLRYSLWGDKLYCAAGLGASLCDKAKLFCEL